MGQCMSGQDKRPLRPRQTTPFSGTSRIQVPRQRFITKYGGERHPPLPPSTSIGRREREIVQEPITDPHRGTTEIPFNEGKRQPISPGVPQPRVPQVHQEESDFDDELSDEPPHEPMADIYPNVDKRAIWEGVKQLLEQELESKEHQLQPLQQYKESASSSRGIEGLGQSFKVVQAESIPFEQKPEDPGKTPMDSAHLDHFNLPSTSGQSSSVESSYFGIQIIKETELHFEGRVGAGRYGIVDLAKWHGADVAVKTFHYGHPNESRRAMEQETKTLSMLKHPSVVTLYGQSTVTNKPAIVTEYIAGRSLKRQLCSLKIEQRTSSVGVRIRAILALNASYAMEYLHSRNIIHFDVKAENFLCDLRNKSHPVVKIADVGLSKYKLTELVTGNMEGTLPWMAPELFPQLGGPPTERQVSNKVDVYSFGIVLWEIWYLGSEPYRNMTANDVLFRILEGGLRPPVRNDCPDYWHNLMQECWNQDPSKRPSFTNIIHELENILKRV